MRAYKIWDTWIDLDHVLGISDARFDNFMGRGGWYVSFHIHLMFKDGALIFSRKFSDKEQRYNPEKKYHEALLIDGSWEDSPSSLDEPSLIQAVANLQKEVEIIQSIWRTKAPICVICGLPYIWDEGLWIYPCHCRRK